MPRSNLFRHSFSLLRHSAPVAALLLSACQAMYFLQGKGSQDALYTFPKDARVLVFIDSPPSVDLPPGYPAKLGDAVSDHLFKFKADTHLVAQNRLSQLRTDPTFAKLGVADIAKTTNADIILYVNLVTFNDAITSGGNLSQGDAHALVKVIDKFGHRLWPTNEPNGHPVDAHLDETLADSRDQLATENELTKQLTTHIGRLFHKYSLDDPEMTK